MVRKVHLVAEPDRRRNAHHLRHYIKLTAATIACLLLLACYFGGVFVSRQQVYTYDRENVLGTSFEFKAIAASEKDADQAMTAASAEIDREAKILSSYDPSSEFSGWFRTCGRPVYVSAAAIPRRSILLAWRAPSSLWS